MGYVLGMKVAILREDEGLGDLFRESGAVLVYVFGSQVDGSANRESDVDVAVLFDDGLTKSERFERRLFLMGRLEKYFSKQVDLVSLNDVRSVFFRYEIVFGGKLLFKFSEEVFLDFSLRVMSEYFDFKPFLDLQNKAYVERSLQ